MKKTLLFLILNSQFLILNSFSQSPDWLWAKSIGGTSYDNGNSIAVDASGNVYTTG
ncbi:MAG: SBBP repeat-containing protein, partial [Bacteroidia bacterium]|nr:SBBP repeat-containing protein [Bacteroidia bacterium]